MEQFFGRVKHILGENGVSAEDKVLVKLVQKHFPDWWRCLNELQRHSVSGQIDSGILADIVDLDVDSLIKFLKNKSSTLFVSGLLRTWTMILMSFSVKYTMLFQQLLSDNLCRNWFLSLLSISTRLPLLLTRD